MVEGACTAGDGGGGIFYTPGSGTCTSQDYGITVKGSSGGVTSCWTRQFTGAVHMKWYGVSQANTGTSLQNANPNCPYEYSYCLDSAITAAAISAAGSGNGCVDLDGLRWYIGGPTASSLVLAPQFGVISVPANVVIGCDDAPIGGVFLTQGSPDFTQMPNALVLYEDPMSFIEFGGVNVTDQTGILEGQTGQVDITEWNGQPVACGDNNTFAYAQIDNEILEFNCVSQGGTTMYLVSRGALGTKDSTHQDGAVFRDVPNNWTVQLSGNDGIENVNILPSWLQTPTDSLTFWRNDVSDMYYGEGLQCVGDGCHIENMYVLGFDTGIEAINAPRLYLRHITVDANTCYQMHSIAGENQGGDTRCFPLLFNGANNANKQWAIENITYDGSGQCQITSTDDGANVPVTGDTIWIANVLAPQSCNGRWTIANLERIEIGTTYYYQYSLAGSSFTGPTTPANWKKGSSVITVTSLANIYGQQNIAGVTYPGSFVCVADTAPFCQTPIAFPGPSPAPTLGEEIGAGKTGNVTVSSTTGWPSLGVIQITSSGENPEDILYTVVNLTTIDVTLRGAYGTTGVKHYDGDEITVGAPSVISVWPNANNNTDSNVAILSAPATCGSGISGCDPLSKATEFLNGTPVGTSFWTTTCSSPPTDVIDSCADIYVSERYWTYNQAAGMWSGPPNYEATPNCSQPNFLTPPLSYGTCPGTGFLIGGHDSTIGDPDYDGNSGFNLGELFSYGHQDQFHIWNSNSTGFALAGSDNHNELNDPNNIGLWFDGNADRSKVDMRETHSDWIDVLQNSSTSDCNVVLAGEMDNNLASAHDFEDDQGCLILTHGNNTSPGLALVSDDTTGGSPARVNLSDNDMPNVTLLGYDSTAQSNILINPTDTFAGSNSVFQAMQTTVTAVASQTSAQDLTASVNVVTSGTVTGGTAGVQLPVSTASVNLGGYAGSNACIQIVNATVNTLTVWPHGSDTIWLGGTQGSPGVLLTAYRTGVFCPAMGTGWIGN